jgi:hypothetical protein
MTWKNVRSRRARGEEGRVASSRVASSRVESRAFHFSSLRSASSSICSSYTFDATLAMNATGIEIASARSKHTLGAESGPW